MEKLQKKAPARAAFDFIKGVTLGTSPGALVRTDDGVLTGGGALSAISAHYAAHFASCAERGGPGSYTEEFQQELAEQLHVLDAACYWRATLGASGDSVACPWGASLYARHSYSSLAWPAHPSV